MRDYFAAKASAAMAACSIPADLSPNVNYSPKPDFGDLQINGAMAAAKRLGRNPRDLAQELVDTLELDQECTKVEIAGPGFINLFLNDDWLSDYLDGIATSDRLGLVISAKPQCVVADYSSPNLAKEMHVGHIRGTVIGDSVVRVLEFLGHRVVRQNHIGDWGTQFGMLIAELDEQLASGAEAEMELDDLEVFYRQAKIHFDEDEAFATRARENVVKLQSGDSHCLNLWQKFIDVSLSHADAIYKKLGVTLTPEHVRGESAYNENLASVVEDLKQLSLAVEDQGAQVVFLEELADKKGNPSPFIVQKADGGFLYATSDLAAIRYRMTHLEANRCLYFIDARQSLHMKQVFATSRKAGWVADDVELLHCAYGTIMGDDGKPFKTRSGDTVKLSDLLDEAVDRANALIAERSPDLDAETRASVAKAVGIGAVKYADLSKTRTNDYVFDWDAMLSFEGNTAPYLQYAYTRIQSLMRKANVTARDTEGYKFDIREPAEKSLSLTLAQFADVVEQVAEKAMPHELCNYVYELSGRFMTFYEACPILKDSVDTPTQQARLKLAELTSRTIKQSLTLLGIDTVERM